MEALRKKLNSSRGACILLALLFLLVCMMVGASILMAAASNAGKIRSNREEQQRYLTLSSALSLVCEELESVEYAGRYTYSRTEVWIDVPDAEGSFQSVYDHSEHAYTQKQGELRSGDGPGTRVWALKEVLPLYNDLDIIFANHFQVPAGQRVPVDTYAHTALNTSVIQPQSPHVLELAVDADEAFGALLETVSITAALRSDGGIVLTASLKSHPEYVMEAVLRANERPERLLVPGSHAAGGSYETAPLRWSLDHIVRREAEDG